MDPSTGSGGGPRHAISGGPHRHAAPDVPSPSPAGRESGSRSSGVPMPVRNDKFVEFHDSSFPGASPLLLSAASAVFWSGRSDWPGWPGTRPPGRRAAECLRFPSRSAPPRTGGPPESGPPRRPLRSAGRRRPSRSARPPAGRPPWPQPCRAPPRRESPRTASPAPAAGPAAADPADRSPETADRPTESPARPPPVFVFLPLLKPPFIGTYSGRRGVYASNPF